MSDYASFKGRMTISGTLTLHSPMHIGSGFVDDILKEDDERGDSIEITGVIQGTGGKPIIPSTSLKGALRAMLEQSGTNATVVDTLFGTIKKSKDEKLGTAQSEKQGCLVPMTATCVEIANLDEIVGWEKGDVPGTYIAQRTAIDGASGVPEKSKLFARYVVAPGATFKLRLILMRDPEGLLEPEKTALKELVGTLQKEGIYLGSGKSDGHGHLTLKIDGVSGYRVDGGKIEDIDGDHWKAALEKSTPLANQITQYSLILASDDPFFVLGSKTKTQNGNKGDNNKLRAVRLKKDTPELPSTSLMGALRASAEWFEALRAMRTETPERKVLLTELFGAEADELDNLKPELAKNISGRRDSKTAPPFRERDITGFAGMLRILSVKADHAPLRTIPSVKIDRFTQGPMDRALFETEAFVGPRFAIELALDHRAGGEHKNFIDAFLDHISSEQVNSGLMLGHATNRGYGWFKVIRNSTIETNCSQSV